jgi:hypothetical protein
MNGTLKSGTAVFVILHRKKANKVFGKRSSRDCSQILHDGSSTEGCIGSFTSSSPGSQDRLRHYVLAYSSSTALSSSAAARR